MTNKEKRSKVFSMLLGDGCIGVYKTDGYKTGRLVIDHGLSQSDLQKWKAQQLSEIFNQPVKTGYGHKGKSMQLCVRNKKFKAWRKFTYPNGRKSLPLVLKYITDPIFAMAVWLMDDGYCEPSFSKLADGSKKNYGARFRIFTATQTDEEMLQIKEWIDREFNVNCSIKKHYDSRQKKYYPLIKLGAPDTLKVWKLIRDLVLQFESMKYKFRYVEQIYQFKITQPTPSDKLDDIVDN